jgi:hypothetical protein
MAAESQLMLLTTALLPETVTSGYWCSQVLLTTALFSETVDSGIWCSQETCQVIENMFHFCPI